ncbi:hypothetical protein L1987_12109 [Smallanthus sonchifolius]|uniref:Uncharacterized protein n=1 Tax=Smallanthus sonchifolius TaxID=185202 RepID=A0ACB9JEY4_9ASTR|nr:hypothetical protein L1987_12109 [Smallanthus sonchifolius]
MRKVRDYIHVAALANAHMAALNSPVEQDPAFLVDCARNTPVTNFALTLTPIAYGIEELLPPAQQSSYVSIIFPCACYFAAAGSTLTYSLLCDALFKFMWVS